MKIYTAIYVTTLRSVATNGWIHRFFIPPLSASWDIKITTAKTLLINIKLNLVYLDAKYQAESEQPHVHTMMGALTTHEVVLFEVQD